MTRKMSKAIAAMHTPAARRKAAATRKRTMALKKKNGTLSIPLAAIPLAPPGAKQKAKGTRVPTRAGALAELIVAVADVMARGR